MSLTDRLDEFRCGVPGCTLVSFGDITTRVALRTSALRQHKQDYLEEILEQAARTFALSDISTQGSDLAMVATPDEVRIFVRCTDGNPDVVCCVCDSAAQADHVAGLARNVLSEMSKVA